MSEARARSNKALIANLFIVLDVDDEVQVKGSLILVEA